MIPNDNISYYTKKEIQDIYNISLSMIDQQIASKKLCVLKIGKCVRISSKELEKWLARYN